MLKKVLGLVTALALLASPVFVGAQQAAPQAGEKEAPQAAENEEKKKVKKAKKAKAAKKEEKKEAAPQAAPEKKQ